MKIKRKNRYIVTAMTFTLLFFFCSNNYPAQDAVSVSPVLIVTTPVTAGAVSKQYRIDMPNKKTNIFVMEIDLSNPFIRIDSIPGAGQITKRASVSDMAANTGAVISINGDFFNTQTEGAPIGPMITTHIMVASPSKIENTYALGITADKTAYISSFTFNGKVTAPDSSVFALSGINKSSYWEEPGGIPSHTNKLHLYDDLWGAKTRGNDPASTPTEMLIKDGIVISISRNAYFENEIPPGMQILRGHGEAAVFLTEKFKAGDTVRIEYIMEPVKDWAMVIGGHGMLVDEGKAIPYTRSSSSISGSRARSAAGISQDGKTLYLIGTQGGSSQSQGMTLSELSAFLEAIGVYRAVNLDGGGSSTLVARPLGQWGTELVYPTEQAAQRLVANAIGIYSDAPAKGPAQLLINTENVILLNESPVFDIKAIDMYYNPVRVDTDKVIFNTQAGLFDRTSGIITAVKTGKGILMVSFQDAKKEIPVEVPGKEDILSLVITPIYRQVTKGSLISPEIKLVTLSGKEKMVDPGLLSWQFYGFDGHITKDGKIYIDDTHAAGRGFAVARYQGYSAPLPFIFSSRTSVNVFDSIQGLTFEAFPTGVKGALIAGFDSSVKLNYDFTTVSVTAAAYIKLPGVGLAIDATTKSISMDVYGNSGNEWIRAELTDARGTLHRFDISPGVDWTGWRTVELDLRSLSYPLLLKRVYIVCQPEQRLDRSLKGDIYFKALKLNKDSILPRSQNKVIELALGEKEIKVNGETRITDAAAVIEDSRTLVPVRFISEALGAEVRWEGAEKNVTIIRGSDWIDLWAGEKMMVVNGRAVMLDVHAKIKEGRVMIPLRAVAEALGLTVLWDQQTKMITMTYTGR